MAIQPEKAIHDCDDLLRIIAAAARHPPLPAGKHVLRTPAPQGFEALYIRLFDIYSDPAYADFSEPVNAIALGVPQYYSVIDQPASVRYVLDGIAEGKFAREEDAKRAVTQIHLNCIKFNGPDHAVSKVAHSLVQRLQDEVRPASEQDVVRFEQLASGADEPMIQRLLHCIKAEAPRSVHGEEILTDQLHHGLILRLTDMLERGS